MVHNFLNIEQWKLMWCGVVIQVCSVMCSVMWCVIDVWCVIHVSMRNWCVNVWFMCICVIWCAVWLVWCDWRDVWFMWCVNGDWCDVWLMWCEVWVTLCVIDVWLMRCVIDVMCDWCDVMYVLPVYSSEFIVDC